MKEQLFKILQEKIEKIDKLKKEYNLLLMVYHILPNEDEVKEKQKEACDKYIKDFKDFKF